MKLSDITAKLTSMKSNIARILATAALGGAVLAVAPAAANAQYFHGTPPRVIVGGPVYGHSYWEHRRFEEERARDWRFHHEYRGGFYR